MLEVITILTHMNRNNMLANPILELPDDINTFHILCASTNVIGLLSDFIMLYIFHVHYYW